jgi:O-acetyl-ADP-ribose deacetylase (regulator of RNase III)
LYDLLKENKDDIIGAMQEDLRKVKAGVIGTGCVCGGGMTGRGMDNAITVIS